MDPQPQAPAAPAAPTELSQVVALLKELVEMHKFNDRPLLTAAEVCKWLGQNLRSMSRAETAGTFPMGVESPSGARWRREDVLKWVSQLKPRVKKPRRHPLRSRVVTDCDS